MIIYIQHKVPEITSIGYLVMAEDGKTDRRTMSNQYPSTSAGDNKLENLKEFKSSISSLTVCKVFLCIISFYTICKIETYLSHGYYELV